MDSKEKFMNFLESIKTEENSKLIEYVEKGFNVCCESGINIPMKVVGGNESIPMMSNLGKSAAESPEVEEVPDIDPDALPEIEKEAPDMKAMLKEEIFRLLANPEELEAMVNDYKLEKGLA